MFDLVIAKGAYHRTFGNLPPFELVNMLPEEAPSVQGGVVLQSFPGFGVKSTVGSGPINGVFREPDLFDGAVFTVSGSYLFRDGTVVGLIDGTGPVWWACSDLELCVGRGVSAYSYNGTDLQKIAFPDAAPVSWGTFIAGMFVFGRANSRKFYWSAVLNARSVDALDFASAESTASYLLQVLAIGDVLYLGCKDKIEAWYPTGDGTLPFLRISQRTAKRGIASSGSMVELDNALHFIGDDRSVYRMADVPSRVSNNGIEEQIGKSSSYLAWSYTWQGHAILMIRLDDASYGADVVTQYAWHERKTANGNWEACCAIQQGDGSPLFGSASNGSLFIHDGWGLAREFTGAIPLKSGQIVDNVELDANCGATDDPSFEPTIEMRMSRDRGETWSSWRGASLGGSGDYRTLPKWRRLGMFDPPGALFNFRVTDAVPLRVSGSSGDTSSAGRSRAA